MLLLPLFDLNRFDTPSSTNEIICPLFSTDQSNQSTTNRSMWQVAIGNGTASRETEGLIADVITTLQRSYKPRVRYAIVSEAGASVYSTSAAAKDEFPDKDPLVIGAVSIARRLQDPLCELVKYDPKAMGVGMYQHDLSTKLLDARLASVVQECVSLVGIDVNTASVHALRHVAGMVQFGAILWRVASVDMFTPFHFLKVLRLLLCSADCKPDPSALP